MSWVKGLPLLSLDSIYVGLWEQLHVFVAIFSNSDKFLPEQGIFGYLFRIMSAKQISKIWEACFVLFSSGFIVD